MRTWVRRSFWTVPSQGRCPWSHLRLPVVDPGDEAWVEGIEEGSPRVKGLRGMVLECPGLTPPHLHPWVEFPWILSPTAVSPEQLVLIALGYSTVLGEAERSQESFSISSAD